MVSKKDEKLIKWLLVVAALVWSIKQGSVATTLVRVFVIICCLPMHELAHGWTAYRLGDPTAKNMGRISLNPFRHLTPEGVFFMLALGFGFARPVPVNIAYFPPEKRKKYHILTSVAGPISNLLMALVFLILARIVAQITLRASGVVSYLVLAGYLNISLAVFNMLPIPPLDGSSLLSIITPGNSFLNVYKYQRYLIFGIFLGSFALHRLGFYPLSDISMAITNAIWRLLILI